MSSALFTVLGSFILTGGTISLLWFVPDYLKQDTMITVTERSIIDKSKRKFLSNRAVGVYISILASYIGISLVKLGQFLANKMTLNDLLITLSIVVVFGIVLTLVNIFPIVRRADNTTVPAVRVTGVRYLTVSVISFAMVVVSVLLI